MVAPNHDRRLQFALGHQVIQRHAEFVPLSISQPADSRWQTLKLHMFLCQRDPSPQMLVLGKHFQYQLVRSRDVRWLTGKRRPAEWPLALAKERPDIRRHEPREIVRVLHALFERACPDVVAVIERYRPQLLQREHP